MACFSAQLLCDIDPNSFLEIIKKKIPCETQKTSDNKITFLLLLCVLNYTNKVEHCCAENPTQVQMVTLKDILMSSIFNKQDICLILLMFQYLFSSFSDIHKHF